MKADYKVLLDACVIANIGVCDLYLRLAEHPRLYLPRWSEEILLEVRRTHKKLGWEEDLADFFQHEIRKTFPEASISGYEELTQIMTNHEKDRHVLAAAVRGGVDLIITFNLRHFRSEDLSKWNVRAEHPQNYLLTLYSINPAIVIGKLTMIAQDRGLTLTDLLINLGKSIPEFSAKVLDDLGC
jgi:predicted nucleic acid-binding protein